MISAVIYILLIAGTVGTTITTMKAWTMFARKEEGKKEKKILLREKRHFKMWGLGFFTREMSDGTQEFWMINVSSYQDPDDTFLGTFADKEFTKCDDYKELPYAYKRGAERLRRKMLGLHDGWGDV